MGGWGLSGWGGVGAPFGGVAADISIVSGFASTIRTVRVSLSTVPQQLGDSAPGDVYNPATWTLKRLDTGAFLTVVHVEQAVDPTDYDIFTLEELPPHGVTLELASTTLKSSLGSVITDPKVVDVDGLAVPRTVSSAQRDYTLQDFANPQVPTPDSVGGTLVMQGGDYATVRGAELVKKLIFRRLFTRPGEFFHLPNYGLGLAEKDLVLGSDMVKLKQEIEMQILQEPEVDQVNVTPTQDASGILTIRFAALLKQTGESVSAGAKVGPNGITVF